MGELSHCSERYRSESSPVLPSHKHVNPRLDHLRRNFDSIRGRASLDRIEARRMYIWHVAK